MHNKLLIKGHKTRYKDVIDILKMLGGKHCGYADYAAKAYYWGIDHYGNIIAKDYTPDKVTDDFVVFSVEEYFEKYPYGIGDRVITMDDDMVTIEKMVWDDSSGEVLYTVKYENGTKSTYVSDFKTFVVEKSKLRGIADKISIPDGYDRMEVITDDNCEFEVVDGKVFVVKKKSVYPNSLKLCADVLDTLPHTKNGVNGYCSNALWRLQQLLICRDAYWKIAGMEMGSSITWIPKFDNCGTQHFCIYVDLNGEIERGGVYGGRHLLAFPTEAMMEIFYENFKELIILCKEFIV